LKAALRTSPRAAQPPAGGKVRQVVSAGAAGRVDGRCRGGRPDSAQVAEALVATGRNQLPGEGILVHVWLQAQARAIVGVAGFYPALLGGIPVIRAEIGDGRVVIVEVSRVAVAVQIYQAFLLEGEKANAVFARRAGVGRIGGPAGAVGP